jgi:hypothetical protein
MVTGIYLPSDATHSLLIPCEPKGSFPRRWDSTDEVNRSFGLSCARRGTWMRNYTGEKADINVQRWW